jgi:capsular exopolysaccharide synthesis family protein
MRDIETQTANLRKYSENLEQARIDQAMENQRISNISVIQNATMPLKSIRPRKLLNIALGLCVGIFGAFLLAMSVELMDHSIKSPNDIEEKLQMMSLGYIPRLKGFSKGKALPVTESNGGKKLFSKSNGSVHVKIQHNYEDLRERLLQRLNGSVSSGYTIGITSCHRKEGVSTNAANLAKTLARQYPNKVLIIDANMSNPSLHKMFGLNLSMGLADILKTGGGQKTIQKLDNMHIITAGHLECPLADILKWDRIKKLLNEARKKYDFTIIDLPAIGQGSTASRFSALCDGVIMVIESERLHREIAQNGRQELAASNTKTLGAILNKRRFYVPGWIYKAV